MKRLVVLGILSFATGAARAGEPGTLEGTVVNTATGEALIEAQVTVVQTGKRVLTDLDGHYQITLPAGVYDVRVWAELRPARRVQKVVIEEGKPTRIDVTLGAAADDQIAVQEVVVVAAPDTATEAVAVVRRQKAATVSDAVSAEQISRSPDSSAGDAVKRVVAATVQDGKYVIVRGLGGRYSSTLLNGVSLPSPDPDNPAAPLDLFPAALLANLTVHKTFSPDIPGNFAGGALAIETRDFPSRFTLKLKLSGSADTATTFRDTADSGGGALDVLGYDDGTRALPAAVPARRVTTSGQDAMSRDEVNAVARSFSNRWALERTRATPNFGVGATAGDTLHRGAARFGWLGALSYGHKWTRRLAETRTGNGETAAEEFQVDMGTESTGLGGLLDLGFAPGPTHRFGLIALYSHSSEDTAQRVTGRPEASGGTITTERTRFRFVERGLGFGQLSGEHALGKGALAWQGHLAATSQSEPDSRDLVYFEREDGLYELASQPGSGDRTYADLSDVSGGGGLDLTLPPWRGLELKTGGAVQITSRDLRARRFHFARVSGADPAMFVLPPEDLFAAENMGTALGLEEDTRADDGYDFRRDVWAGYGLLDGALGPLRAVAGARVEAADQELVAVSPQSTAPPSMPVSHADLDVMPALNLILGLRDAENLRASYSRTVARPHIRELAPFKYFDYARSRVTSGNPDLETTGIHNLDLRYEKFFGATDLIAASVFYKRFVDPIETVITPNNDVTYRNALGASSYGGELEVRFALAAGFRLAANLTLIRSEVEFDPDDTDNAAQTSKARPLQGQSPYVGNLELGWRPREGSDLTLLWNVFGERISEAGVNHNVDVYEKPFHRLDLSYAQKLPQSLALKLSATNLLAQRARFEQGKVELYGYDPGVAFLASIEWSLDQ